MPALSGLASGLSGLVPPKSASAARSAADTASRWSTTDHYPSIFTVMGGLLFSSDPQQGGGHGIRGQKAAAGRAYLEFIQATAINGATCGIANPGFDLNNFPGGDGAGNSIGYHSGNGGYYLGGGSPKTFGGTTQQTAVGAPIGMAVDSAARLLWFFLAGQWWGSGGYGAGVDPAAGTGGITTPAGPLLPAAANGTGSGGYVLNTGSFPFQYPLPSSYQPWG